MIGRVAVDADHRQPFQIRLRFPVQLRAAYHLVDALLRYQPYGIGEVTAEVYLDNPCRPGVTLRHLKDVFYQLVNSRLTTHTFAIVEGKGRQHLVGFWYYNLADFCVYHTASELCGEDFPPAWTWCEKGVVVKDTQRAVVAVVHGTHQQRCSVRLELRGVLAPALILACLLHQSV